MESANRDLEDTFAGLVASPVRPSEIATRAPVTAGLYAWWAPPTVFPSLLGPAHPSIGDLRLICIGIATKLRTRLASNHMRRSGSSTLRRTLAGLLMDDEHYRTRWTDRVVLVDSDEARLTEWMTANLRVSWHECTAPGDLEGPMIRTLRPPLNIAHASGPAVEQIRAARWAYAISAGKRPPGRRSVRLTHDHTDANAIKGS